MKPQSIETSLAYQRLKQLKEDEVCPYDELRTIIGKNPQGDGYPYVVSARRKVERELECVLLPIKGVGIKRLPPRDVINKGAKDLKGIRRSVNQGLRRQTTIVPVEEQRLSNDEKIQFHGQLAAFGALNAITKPSAIKKITEATTGAARTLPATDTLNLFVKPNSKG